MKKKIFSKLLMGAFLFASISAFVSCKDYDDDINANRADIRAAQEQLATLTGNLSSLQTKLENEKAALQQELATAKSQLETQIANAKAELNTAIAAKADQATVDALALRVANLETDLAATKEAFQAKIDAINTSLATLQGIVEKKADQTYVDQLIATLQTAIAGKVSTEDFNLLKGDFNTLKTNLENLTTLVGTKASTEALNAAVAAINQSIETLTNNINGKVSTEVFNQLKDKVDGIQTTVNDLVTAVSNKADKSELSALDTRLSQAISDLQKLITDDLVTNDKLNAAVAALMDLINQKAGQTEFAALADRVGNIETALATRDENITKQLTDAINDLRKELMPIINSKVDQEEYNQTVADIQADIQEAQDSIASILVTLAAVNGDIDNIFDWIDAAEDSIAALRASITNNAIAIRALQLQGNAIVAFLGEIEGKTLAQTLADLKSKMSQEVKDSINKQNAYRAAAIAEIGQKIAALKTELQNAIDSNTASIEQLQEDFANISDIIDARIAENINNLTAFVSKSLKSISLVPQLFIDGIEAIEFTSLQYKPMKGGTSGLGNTAIHNQYLSQTNVTIDNGLAEAYYRLNPSIVERSSIDESKMEFLAATAETRAATVTSPVAFNGIANWNYQGKKGLIKVNLKKTTTASLNNPPSGNIYIVALKVPRKATTISGQAVEAADIVSENSRLTETIRTPRIARKAWKGNGEEKLKWKDMNGTVRNNSYDIHHYTDSVTMYNQDVDDDQLVYAKVNYNQTLDISKLVTACDIETPKDHDQYAGIDNPASGSFVANHTSDHQITVDQLKKYGLAFRYAIATKEYKMDVDHSTDQQKFAVINRTTGILSSAVPQLNGSSVVDNRACVGKEPIIRIELIDTVHNNIVDQRYMKVKWVEPNKGTKDLGNFEISTVLKPCDLNGQVGVTWLWFVDKAYSKAEISGMSQATFAAIYMDPNHLPTVADVTYVPNRHWSMLSAAVAPGKPVVKQTTNEHGDALIATWSLMPNEIANIYPSQQKTFTAKITFHSILNTEYPDLTMNFVWTITLPSLPEINGYYDNYWFNKYAEHYVMPVQFNTAQYNLIKNGKIVPGKSYGINSPATGMQKYDKANNTVEPGTDYCVFYNSITNPFTYEQKSNIPQFIVKNLLGSCSTWDMQFTWTGPDAIEALGKWNSSTNKWTNVGSATKNYVQYGSYRPASNTNSPSLNKISWKTAGAYKLETAAGAQALQLEWWGQKQDFHATGEYDQTDEAHVAWDNVNSTWGGKKYNYAVLYADHHNAANQALLNPITPKGIGIEPDRSHTKGIQMGIWGTLNDWNIIPVKDYKFYLVEPLAINAELGGAFEEGYVSGTAVSCDDAFEMTDFRGYEVKNVAASATAGEFVKYRQALWKYYEVEDPVWNLADVKYGLKVVNGQVKSDNTNKMTAQQISLLTNGNIRLSIEKKTYNGVDYLVFKNNGGSNVEEEVWVYIPVTASYGFGSVSKEAKVRLYPKDGHPSGVTIMPYPGI